MKNNENETNKILTKILKKEKNLQYKFLVQLKSQNNIFTLRNKKSKKLV